MWAVIESLLVVLLGLFCLGPSSGFVSFPIASLRIVGEHHQAKTQPIVATGQESRLFSSRNAFDDIYGDDDKEDSKYGDMDLIDSMIPKDDLAEKDIDELLREAEAVDIDFATPSPSSRGSNIGQENDPTTKEREIEPENDVTVPHRLGFSTRVWGNTFNGYWPDANVTDRGLRRGYFGNRDLLAAYETLVSYDIKFVETSPLFGNPPPFILNANFSAESLIGEFSKQEELGDPILMTKFARRFFQSRHTVIEKSTERLGRSPDIVEFPYSGWLPSGSLVRQMREVIADGGHVGVRNLSPASLRSLVQRQGVPVTTNRFHYSLIDRSKEHYFQACRDLGVTPLVYNPYHGGLGNNEYTYTTPLGVRGGRLAWKYWSLTLKKFQPLQEALKKVALDVARRRSKNERGARPGFIPKKFSTTASQIVLQYIIAKGGVPLPEVNNLKEAEELVGCLGWSLLDDEVAELDDAANISQNPVRRTLWRRQFWKERDMKRKQKA